MTWQYNPYAIPLFISAIPLAGIIYFGWRNRANLALTLPLFGIALRRDVTVAEGE